MNLKSNKLFLERCKKYFENDYDSFIKCLNESPTKSFFLNRLKGSNVLDYITIK